MTAMTAPNRNRMEPYWLPFTANRAFKANPKLFAGADVFTMPSRFKPCGLAQMQAMRYGTLPLVNR